MSVDFASVKVVIKESYYYYYYYYLRFRTHFYAPTLFLRTVNTKVLIYNQSRVVFGYMIFLKHT